MVAAPQLRPFPRSVAVARKVLDRLKLRPPIDILAAIRAADLPVLELVCPENTDGHIAYLRGWDQFGIAINPRFRDPLRRRVTLAHEFGHYMLHREIIRAHGQAEVVKMAPWLEQEAFQFASELLMPADEVRVMWLHAEPERYFRVNRAAWERRLRELDM